jgi:hypothetical protein
MSVIPELGRLRQEDLEMETSLSYIVTLSQNRTRQNTGASENSAAACVVVESMALEQTDALESWLSGLVAA